MQIIAIDARSWRTLLDFYDAILKAIGAPEWNGQSVQALMDAMIWDGLSVAKPPYTVRISRTANLPKEVSDHIALVQKYLAEGRTEYRERKGSDIDVRIELLP